MKKITTRSPLIDNFVRAFDYYRSKSDKTGRDIAKHLGTSAPTVSNWGAGKHLPDMDTLQRLAEYLHAPIEQFFYFTALDNPESEELQKLISVLHKLSDEDIKILKIVADRMNK